MPPDSAKRASSVAVPDFSEPLMRTLIIGLALLLPNLAYGQTALAWKFKTGDVFFYETKSKSDEATVVKGQTLKQEVTSTWVYRFEVRGASAESATLQVSIDQVTVTNAAATTKTDNKNLEKAKGAILIVTVSPRGEIASLDGYDKLIDHIADKREGMAKVMRQLMPEAAVRQQIQDLLVVLPKEPVASGSRWRREGIAMPMAPLGRFVVALSGTHSGNDLAGHHRLGGTLAGKYERPDAPADSFRVTGGSLSLDQGQWSCAFDNDRGRAVTQKMSYELRGELTIEKGGAATPVEVLIRREMTTRLLAREK
jgi:hypothetical protein